MFGGTNKFPLAGSTFHGDLGKPGDHCQSARPCFQTAQQEKKCQQAAFNAAHLPTLSADVPGGLSERYYELLWMSCILPAATYTLRSDNPSPRDDIEQTFREEFKDFQGNAVLILRFSNFRNFCTAGFRILRRNLSEFESIMLYCACVFPTAQNLPASLIPDYDPARWQARKSAIKHIPSRGL